MEQENNELETSEQDPETETGETQTGENEGGGAGTEQPSLEETLAREFLDLQRECPEVESFSSLPAWVKEQAIMGMSLLTAYLLFLYREHQKAEAEKQAQKTAQAATVGKMDQGTDKADSMLAAFLKGLN